MAPPWKAVVEEEAGLYYFNFETGESLWEHPTTQLFRNKVKIEREKYKKTKVTIDLYRTIAYSSLI